MKKILCIALALTMTVGVMAGCSSNKDPLPDNPPESSSTVDENVPETPTTPDVSEPEVIPPSDEAPEVTAATPNERLGIIIDRVRDDESKEAFTVQTTNENGVLDLLGLTEDDVAEYAITYSPMNVHAYMIAVIKPADGHDDAVTAALKSYHQSMVKSFEQYLPDQLKIAEDAVVFADEGYLGLVMCENSTDVEKNLVTGLKGVEDIKIVPADENTEDTATTGDEANQEDSTEPTDNNTEGKVGKATKDITDAAKNAVENLQDEASKNTENTDGSQNNTEDTVEPEANSESK